MSWGKNNSNDDCLQKVLSIVNYFPNIHALGGCYCKDLYSLLSIHSATMCGWHESKTDKIFPNMGDFR